MHARSCFDREQELVIPRAGKKGARDITHLVGGSDFGGDLLQLFAQHLVYQLNGFYFEILSVLQSHH